MLSCGLQVAGSELLVHSYETRLLETPNPKPGTRNSLEVLGFTFQKIAAANCAGELPVARCDLAANSYNTRTAFDFPSLKRAIVNVHQLSFGRNRTAIVGIEHHQIGVRTRLDRSFAREERK